MLRLLIGVLLEVVAFDFIGVDVDAESLFSVSESECFTFRRIACFLTEGSLSLSIFFWFAAKSFVRSDIISFLSDVLISSNFSDCLFGDLLGPVTKFSG